MGAVAKHVVLVGMMGAGKSAVGRRVAARLVRPFSDSDTVVEDRMGRTVGEIWRTDGEAAFRQLEAEALQESLADPTPSVIAAAGGHRARRREPGGTGGRRRRGHLAPGRPAILLGRVRHGDHRPLLDEDPDGRAPAAPRGAGGLYTRWPTSSSTWTTWTSTRSRPGCSRRSPVIRVPVAMADQPYEVLVGAGARHRLLEVLPVGAERAAVVTQAGHRRPVDPGVEHEIFLLDDGEEAKCLEDVDPTCPAAAPDNPSSSTLREIAPSDRPEWPARILVNYRGCFTSKTIGGGH